MVGPRKLAIPGATGSIGQTVARVLEQGGDFGVAAVAAGRDGAAPARTAIRLGARFAAVGDPAGFALVAACLARKIAFGDIFRLVASTCDKALAGGKARTPATVEDALAIHHMVKESLTPHLV